jgi:hypothetical protein
VAEEDAKLVRGGPRMRSSGSGEGVVEKHFGQRKVQDQTQYSECGEVAYWKYYGSHCGRGAGA